MIKKLWVREKEKWVCYPCNSPYNAESIIKEGVSIEEWDRLETVGSK